MPDSQDSGSGPAWLDPITFDIDAKSDPSVDAELDALPTEQARDQKQRMVQALLADRFELQGPPKETRQLPVYALIVTKDGPKFKPVEDRWHHHRYWPNALAYCGQRRHLLASSRAVAALVLGRVVLNQTGLNGRYDLSLRWTPDDPASSASSSPDAPPDIFTAIQEQLGLKLESTKGPVSVLVIDSVEKPSLN